MASIEVERCSNPKWRFCSVEAGFCKNCKKCYIKQGDVIETKCRVCGEKKRCKVDTVYGDKSIDATCKICNSAVTATEDIFGEFCWCPTNDKLTKTVNKILELPKDDLRVLLVELHGRIER